MSIITIPLNSKDDDLLVMVAATFLTRNGVLDMSAYPVALTLLAALEQYSQDRDIERCARELEIMPEIVALYKKEQGR